MKKGVKSQGSNPRTPRSGGGGGSSGLFPNSLRLISSCLKSVTSNATTVASNVRSAGASVAASVSVAEDQKDQVQWAGFDRIDLSPSNSKCVLLLGYSNGFQVLDVEDASNVRELVSKRDGLVTFLQMQPIPAKSMGHEGFRASHPLLLVVAGEETSNPCVAEGGFVSTPIRDGTSEPQLGNHMPTPTVVRFYSLRSHTYVHVLRFRSSVYAIRCSPCIVAVALEAQIYCFDAVTLENKFSVLTYPIPHGGHGAVGVNIGYGPMAVGPRWLAYAPNHALMSNTGRLSPQIFSPSPGVSPSTSPGNGSLVARYAVESSKQLATGIINLSDRGYRTLSKYCQELLPDSPSSPISSNSNWKVVKVSSATHPNEPDDAGMVVVRDFISKAVVAQFRAHTSPISALSFDPSGTLLVTASIHGNNINVFRIMPSGFQNGASSAQYDWSNSHVHLYKLYRGLTSAVIQDICFSDNSNWVAIVSTKGTCHIFVLSPFGGDVGFHSLSVRGDGSTLLPSLSLPWWTTTGFCVLNQQDPPPPPPPTVTLAVVSRIKNSNTGWLSTVSNAAASVAGKMSVPSGAIAAAFHNSVRHDPRSKAGSLEHLLVYSPSGHLIQHELLPVSGVESSESTAQNGHGPSGSIRDEELRMLVEPVQWWDVCRRSYRQEREESISCISFDGMESNRASTDNSDYDNETKCLTPFNNGSMGKDLVKVHDRPHLYLSNAEVHISLGRIPIWQKSKICFYTMVTMDANERKYDIVCIGGEMEIEKLPVREFEIRQKDLLPVFEHFHGIQSDWSHRGLDGGRYPRSSSLEAHQTKDKFIETVTRHSASGGRSSIGSSRTPENLLDPDWSWAYESTGLKPVEKSIKPGSLKSSSPRNPVVNELDGQRDNVLPLLPQSATSASQTEASTGQDHPSIIYGLDRSSVGRNDCPEVLESVDLNNGLGFGEYFHEGYCKISEEDDSQLPEAITDADSASSHCEREKPEEDGDNDDMLGDWLIAGNSATERHQTTIANLIARLVSRGEAVFMADWRGAMRLGGSLCRFLDHYFGAGISI